MYNLFVARAPAGAAGLYYVAVLGGVLFAARWGVLVCGESSRLGRGHWVALGGVGAAGVASGLGYAGRLGVGVEWLGLGWVYGSRCAWGSGAIIAALSDFNMTIGYLY